METEPVRASADWLALREPADADARASELVGEEFRSLLRPRGVTTVHDLGCGTGGMARWLAPRLDGHQHWVLHDRDAELLVDAAGRPPAPARDGAGVTVEPRRDDITRLPPAELADADLITASALLDMLTAEELHRLVTLTAGVGCPVLVTLSVVGRVELAPADPLDHRVAAAFNDHQRRTTAGGPLLGPDAARAAVAGFRALGREVEVRSSPWRLGPGRAQLLDAWFRGWWSAAIEQRPELAEEDPGYAGRRLDQLTAGGLTATVHHRDLLVRPRV